MEPYEITYLILPSLTAEEAVGFHEDIKKIIGKENGVLGNEQSPVKKPLAYLVKQHGEGYLASLDFQAKKEDVKKIGEKIKKEKNIMRYLLVGKQVSKKPEKKRRTLTDSTEEPEKEKPVKEKKKKSLKPAKAKLQEIDDKIDEML